MHKRRGLSQAKACTSAGVLPSTYRKWKKKEKEIIESKNIKALTLHSGKKSCIHNLENTLLEWFNNVSVVLE